MKVDIDTNEDSTLDGKGEVDRYIYRSVKLYTYATDPLELQASPSLGSLARWSAA
jgi:hypothetical protein